MKLLLILTLASPLIATPAVNVSSVDTAGRLVYRDSQSGFAGTTTTIVTVEADGHYLVSTELDDLPIAEPREGKMAEGRMIEIMGLLESASAVASIDEAPAVNARRIEIFWDGLAISAHLDAFGLNDPSIVCDDLSKASLARLMLTLQKATEVDDPSGMAPANCGAAR